MRNWSSCFQTLQEGKLTMFKTLRYDSIKAIEDKDLNYHLLEEIIPKQYNQFLLLFCYVLSDRLSQVQRGIDHEVRLRVGETFTSGPLYSMSRTEFVVLKKWLEKNRSKGFIQQSSSPFAAPLLFATKPYAGL